MTVLFKIKSYNVTVPRFVCLMLILFCLIIIPHFYFSYGDGKGKWLDKYGDVLEIETTNNMNAEAWRYGINAMYMTISFFSSLIILLILGTFGQDWDK